MIEHKWIKSTLGHGETMCENCKVTNREAAVLEMTHCDSGTKFDRMSETDKHE